MNNKLVGQILCLIFWLLCTATTDCGSITVYVSPTGSPSIDCGRSRDDPCDSLSLGLAVGMSFPNASDVEIEMISEGVYSVDAQDPFYVACSGSLVGFGVSSLPKLDPHRVVIIPTGLTTESSIDALMRFEACNRTKLRGFSVVGDGRTLTAISVENVSSVQLTDVHLHNHSATPAGDGGAGCADGRRSTGQS